MGSIALMSRRVFAGVGVMAGLATLCPLRREPLAQAATITSWDFPANGNLSQDDAAARFEDIIRAYEVGEPLCDEDADFVLRYAMPVPTGRHTVQIEVTAEDAESGYQLSGSSCIEYLGNFVYRGTTTLQVGSSEKNAESMSIQTTHAVFGYAFPSDGASLSMLDRFEHNEMSQNRTWFAAEVSDDFVGVAVASWQGCRAVVVTDAGDEILLEGAFCLDESRVSKAF